MNKSSATNTDKGTKKFKVLDNFKFQFQIMLKEYKQECWTPLKLEFRDAWEWCLKKCQIFVGSNIKK